PGEVRNDLLRSSRVELLSPSEVDSRLPARARALMGPGAQPLPPRAGPHRVLVVDDSETFLQRVAESLRAEGYAVSLARSGDEALATLDEQTKGGAPPDAILLDMVMPGLSGDETCRRIKANPQWRPIPVVVHTGRDDPRAILDALNAGADDF